MYINKHFRKKWEKEKKKEAQPKWNRLIFDSYSLKKGERKKRRLGNKGDEGEEKTEKKRKKINKSLVELRPFERNEIKKKKCQKRNPA